MIPRSFGLSASRAGVSLLLASRDEQKLRTRIWLVHRRTPASQCPIAEHFYRSASSFSLAPFRPTAHSPQHKPVPIIPLNLIPAKRVHRIAVHHSVDPDREPPLLVELREKGDILLRKRGVVYASQAGIEHLARCCAQEDQALLVGPGGDVGDWEGGQ